MIPRSVRRLAGPLVVGGALALAAATAPAASAGDVWLWVCQGPEGQALPENGDRATRLADADGVCGEEAPRALRARPGTRNATWAFRMPASTTLNRLRLHRNVNLGAQQRYRLQAGATTLESAEPNGTLSGEAAFDASGPQVVFEATCEAIQCSQTQGADLAALAFRVTDNSAPTGAVSGWRSPASGLLELQVHATDNGVGLRDATVWVGNTAVGDATFNDRCADLSSDPATVDLPYGLVNQDDVNLQPVGCLTRGTAKLTVDTTKILDSVNEADLRTISVTVTDHAGNTGILMQRGTEIINRSLIENIASRTLVIGSSITDPPPFPRDEPQPPTGGVGGAQATSGCAEPALTMVLDQAPLRTTRGVIVLQRNKRYRFAGRLTCNVGGVRRSAPKRTRIDIRTTIGGRTRSATARTGERGAVRAFLRAARSGAVVFRYSGPRGRRSQVTIRFRVERGFPRATAIYGRWLRYESPSDRVRFTELEARSVPAGATVKVSCRGSACPGSLSRSFSAGKARSSMSLLGAVSGAQLRPGAAIDVTITKPGYGGIGKLYCVRTGQKVLVRSYRVGAGRPACNAGASAAAKRAPIRGAIRESG